ncbi:hypothetical protein A4X13_0g1180 [Tilletia indica]|uniref:Uncharacterized protein n=1 Tax=Tilletia indica TaxID=43049 RepID=A0A177TR34_9BASI|nr:hypothetical protein A4X13_0g1180 [Tilletia indica]
MFNKALLQYKVARAAPPLFIVAKPNPMTLPKEWAYPTKPAVDVGSVHDRTTISIRDLLQVYALNKSRCPDPANAVSFALLRMEAVKAGWVDVANQPEIARADPWDDDTARRSFLTDYRRIMDECPRAARAAYCLPLISEFIFRATGHPWRADEERLYDDLYRSTLIACHLPGVIGYLPPWLLYHEALHWIGPARQMEVLKAQLDLPSLPYELKYRACQAPAGTALLDTSVQVIDALESLNLAEEFGRSGAYDFELLKTVLEAVKKDPFKYHQSYHRYGVDPPTTAELSTLEKAKEVAIKFAPVAQAFIESGLGDASLSNQTALERHADLNPKMKKRCKTLFRKYTLP